MATRSFVVYSFSLAALVAALVCLGAYLSWRAHAADGFTWQVQRGYSPLWCFAQVAFVYASLLCDVAFIRTAVVLGTILITAWITFGCAPWPGLWNSPVAGIYPEQFASCFLSIVLNAVPMFRQFRFDDSKVCFDVQRRYLDSAEAVWREWWRRSGIPRVDFEAVLAAGEFVEVAAGGHLDVCEPMESGPLSAQASLLGEDTGSYHLDAFYYVVRGRLRVKPHGGSGLKEFTIGAGQFLDAFALLSLLGQTSVNLAMQTGPNEVTALQDSLLVKWPLSTMRGLRFRFDTFIPQCLRTVVSAATLDRLFRHEIEADTVDVFEAVEGMRLDMVRAHLPKSAANLERSLWEQFLMSHISFRDLWQPSPHQRVANSIQTGSREMGFMQELKQSNEALANMRHVCTCSHTRVAARNSKMASQSVRELGGESLPLQTM